MKNKLPTVHGRVMQALPNTQFLVEFNQNSLLPAETKRCIISGKMKKSRIRVLVGDEVTVEFPDAYGNTVGRIKYRGLR